MDIQAEMKQKAEAAKRAAARLALLSTDVKNKALLAMADALEKRSELILKANELDLEEARQKKVRRSYLDRLMLDEGRIASMAEGLRQTALLPDPVGQGDYSTVRPNGLRSAACACRSASSASFTKHVPMSPLMWRAFA